MIRKGLAFLTLMLLAMLLMLSCQNSGNSEGGESKPNISENSEGTDTHDDTASNNYNVTLENLAKYVVVRPDTADSSTIDAARLVSNAIRDKLGCDVSLKTDFYKEGVNMYQPSEYEILVGQTNRPESTLFSTGLRTDDYGYDLIGTRIVITGTDGDDTYKAAEQFVKNVIEKYENGSDEVFSSRMAFVYRGEYRYKTLSLDGVDIGSYVIVYARSKDKTEQMLAENLADIIRDKYAFVVRVEDDDSPPAEHEILIGITSRDTGGIYSEVLADDECFIGKKDGRILLWAKSSAGTTVAVNRFIDMLRSAAEYKSEADLSLDARSIVKTDTEKMTAMSFNVYVSNISSERADRVITLIKNYMPDTIGIQEASPTWMNLLQSKLGSIYSYVGEGREGGNKGEYNPVFYRKDKFTLIESGTKWLSDTPDKVSKYSESSHYRIMTYAILKRKDDGKIFVHVNTHLNHQVPEVRVKQAKVLVELMKAFSGYQVILTGDFNCKINTQEFNVINNSDVTLSLDIAQIKENNIGTYHGYNNSDSLIDFIFVTKKRVLVTKYKVANEKINGEYASDHHPVYIEYTLIG